ncbi:MAG: YkvA family protein [Anaerovoracaceae bacterium]|jgi:uncharacterized membrane protein YkvA (DUF1232 family)
MQFFLGFRVLIKRIKAIRFMMKDKSVSIWKKLLIVLGIVYLFLPVDIIPPILFPVGWIDDLILWLVILWFLRDTLDKYWKGEKPVDYSKKYKDTIDVDDYEVKDKKKGNREEKK